MASSPDLITAWRIVNVTYAATAFDGEGARISGGRWTSPGLRATYTADSVALAALEIFVHLQSAMALAEYRLIACRFPRRFVTTIVSTMLPSNWHIWPAPAPLRRIGDEWLATKATAVLAVPSAVVDVEQNFVINPAHPDFEGIEIDPPRPFTFDARLTRVRW